MPTPAPDVAHFETAVRIALNAPYDTGLVDAAGDPVIKPKVGSTKWGVYAFYDYEDEPIYVGQTRERLSGRVRRHLTNQRTDAVGMRVLDPYEVKSLALWPIVDFDPGGARVGLPTDEKKVWLDRLERTIYDAAIAESRFGVILNEKLPPDVEPLQPTEVPNRFIAQVVPEEVLEERSHPENRIQRRAETLSRLCSVIRERPSPSTGLRRVAVVQSVRLAWLAAQRLAEITGDEPDLDPRKALHQLLGAGALTDDDTDDDE